MDVFSLLGKRLMREGQTFYKHPDRSLNPTYLDAAQDNGSWPPSA